MQQRLSFNPLISAFLTPFSFPRSELSVVLSSAPHRHPTPSTQISFELLLIPPSFWHSNTHTTEHPLVTSLRSLPLTPFITFTPTISLQWPNKSTSRKRTMKLSISSPAWTETCVSVLHFLDAACPTSFFSSRCMISFLFISLYSHQWKKNVVWLITIKMVSFFSVFWLHNKNVQKITPALRHRICYIWSWSSPYFAI